MTTALTPEIVESVSAETETDRTLMANRDNYLDQATRVKVVDRATYEQAASLLGLIKRCRKAFEERRKERTTPLLAVKKSIDDDYKPTDTKLAAGIQLVDAAMNRFAEEEERKAEAARKAEEERIAKEEKAREEKALEEAAAAATPEEAEKIVEEAAAVEPPAPPPAAKVASGPVRGTYASASRVERNPEIAIVDFGKVPEQFIKRELDTQAVVRWYKQRRKQGEGADKISIPGLTITPKYSHSSR